MDQAQTPWFLFRKCFVITLGYIQFGFGNNYFNSCTKFMYKLHQNENEKLPFGMSPDTFNAVVTAMVPAGALIGTLFGGLLIKKGRVKAIYLIDLIIMIGSILHAIWVNFWCLLICRMMIGLGVGLSVVVCPSFVNEISKDAYIGITGSFAQIMLTAGMTIANIAGFLIPYNYLKDPPDVENPDLMNTNNWRIIFCIPAIVAFAQFILMLAFYRKDSPAYFMEQNKPEKANHAWEEIYGRETYVSPEQLISGENSDSSDNRQTVRRFSFCDIFSKFKRALYVGCGLCFVNQMCGANPIAFFSFDIFTQGKEDYITERDARIGGVLLGVFSVIASIIAACLLDKVGRRTIMLWGFIAMCALQFGLFGVDSILGSMLEYTDLKEKLEIILCIVFLFSYNMSLGTVMTLYNAEILPPFGVAMTQSVNWSMTILVSLGTKFGFNTLTGQGMFILFCVVNFISATLTYFRLKETKDVEGDAKMYLYDRRDLYANQRLNDSEENSDMNILNGNGSSNIQQDED